MTEQNVTDRLAAKLAAADLDDQEASLLVQLLSGGSEVEGFGQQPQLRVIEYQDGTDLFANPGTHSKWIDVLNHDW